MATLTCEMLSPIIAEMNGNLSAVARKCRVARRTLYRFIEAHPSLQDVIFDARETMLDNGESALYRAVLNGEAWAVCFFLKTQGKSRGYVERQEHTGLHLDVSQLADDQLERIAAGEDPIAVLAAGRKR
jgi:hypothetical protein